MEKYINQWGKECYRGVEMDSPFSPEIFHMIEPPQYNYDRDSQYALFTNLGCITVLDRMTGFGWRDVETGYRDPDGAFWLASGNCNVMESGVATVGEAIEWVKKRANTCTGEPTKRA